MNRSEFTKVKGYIIDTFPELAVLPPSLINKAEKLSFLRAKESLNPSEKEELSALAKELVNYEINPETWNKLCDCMVNMETFIRDEVIEFVEQKQREMNLYTDNKKAEMQAEIDKFMDKGDYDPVRVYYKNNIVHFQVGNKKLCYKCERDGVMNIDPSNPLYWIKWTIEGDKGEKGENGVGLIPDGVYSSFKNYPVNVMVYHKGYTFASLKPNNIGHEPVPNMDTEWWSMVFKSTVVGTVLEGITSITSNAKTIKFIGLGNIVAFNPNIDTIEVMSNTPLLKGVEYEIAPDNQSISCIDGEFVATVDEPAYFAFRIGRNQINNLVFSDGNSIAKNSIPEDRLSVGVLEKIQSSIDKIDILTTNIGDKTLINTGFKDNLVGAINEINEKVIDYIYDVVTSDTEGKPTSVTYKRSDNTLYKEVSCSNADINGYYQTVIEKTYGVDGITLQSTKTYTFTYNADGYVLTKRWVTV